MRITTTTNRTKISDYPEGTIFSWDSSIWMKILDAHGNTTYVDLVANRLITPPASKVEYDSVVILDAELVICKDFKP